MFVSRSRLTVVVRLLLTLLVGLALFAGVQALPSEAATKAAKVKALISKVIKSKNPKKTYYSLSKANRALIKKELTRGAKRLHWRSSPSTLALPSSVVPNSGVPVTCWSKTLVADWYGGVTKRLMFSTTNTTRVCVSSGSVQKVSVVQAFQDVSALGWHPDGVTKSTLDVNWEGRGVARGSFAWGAGGWYFIHGTLCSQVRLNADMIHYAGLLDCKVNT